MRIAIYDENPAHLDALHAHVVHFFDQREQTQDVCLYASSTDFTAAIDDSPFDLAFIALGQQSRTGFALARNLRYASTDCDIVFVSEYPEFMSHSIAYRPAGYLIQPVSEGEVSAVLAQVLRYQWHPNRYYDIRIRNQAYRIPHREIRYFQSDGHRVLIHLDAQREPMSHLCRLNLIEQSLEKLDYLRCHQSYLVHLPYVRMLNRKTMNLVLADGTEIPVSKRYYGRVTNALLARNQI